MFEVLATAFEHQPSISMPRAKLTVYLPEALWIHEISTAYRDATFRVSSVLPGADVAIGVIELVASNPVPILAATDDHDDVTDIELLWKHDETAVLQVETTDPSVLAPMQRAGVPMETPFEVEDGAVTWELTTSADRLSTLGDAFDEQDIQYRIEYVHAVDASRAENPLTDRQLEVFLAALDAGYYDVPREATLTDVASALGVTKSTCSDVLHRAESTIAHWFAEDHGARESHGQ
ncbi:helix-turn-helix domain-containing protein [Haloterrigena sp. SYSU A121-1]|uniref:Helix-turn-helix domain-containing protein n=1 Tax=Haloterrigena gelatinilytica TaxID=2741724 RepID=A0A8J8KHI8_9EURY|nr:helix-turn-helix domain-containing protein [Haloterrigena gelatinilytica]NUB93566.1 helix-turn-helix domain-containing protein [Haloterrigena gelatinilytica]